MPNVVHYIPIATTVLSVVFAAVIIPHASRKGWPAYLTWWAIGVVAYGAGTLTESITTVFSWNGPTFRAWYIAGALLGGAPLAQGTVYLLLKKRAADVLSVLLVVAIVVALACILIAVGALLPGIGGSFTRFGMVEVLYVTELVGLSLIFAGYLVMKADRSASVHRAQTTSDRPALSAAAA